VPVDAVRIDKLHRRRHQLEVVRPH
jgi:hypothetical protein